MQFNWCHFAFFLLLLVSESSRAQSFQFNMYFRDAIGNRDTITLGLDSMATVGVDTVFGEINIMGQPYNNGLDVRITDEFKSRQYGVQPTYHLKKQIIPDYFFILNIDIKTAHYPVTAYWQKTPFQNDPWLEGSLITSIHPGGWWDTGSPSDMFKVLLFWQDSVVFTSNIATDYFNPNYAYVSNNNDSIPVYWLVFGPENIGVSTKTPEAKPKVVVYPNPAGDYLYVSGLDPIDQVSVEIFDAMGKLVLTSGFASGFLLVDKLNQGMYSIILHMPDNSTVSRIFIKN